MDLAEFLQSLSESAPPTVALELVALWYDKKGDWEAAHEAAQSSDTSDCAWVHAYLHRKEGDIGNAGYWYRRAGKQAQTGSLDDEWDSIVETLLEKEMGSKPKLAPS